MDRRKTLTELERSDWGPPTYDSHLVTTCHALRHKPIGDLSTEELRILIGQKIGLAFLVPIVVETLTRDPLADGAYYRGDLLKVFLALGATYWSANRGPRDAAREIISSARARLTQRQDDDPISPIEEQAAVEAFAMFTSDTAALDP